MLDRKYYDVNTSPFFSVIDDQPSPPWGHTADKKCTNFPSNSDLAILDQALNEDNISIRPKTAQSLPQRHKIRGPQICRRLMVTEESLSDPIAPLPLLRGSVLLLLSKTPTSSTDTNSSVPSQLHDGFFHQS